MLKESLANSTIFIPYRESVLYKFNATFRYISCLEVANDATLFRDLIMAMLVLGMCLCLCEFSVLSLQNNINLEVFLCG